MDKGETLVFMIYDLRFTIFYFLCVISEIRCY
jgi:hypothetical protein